MSKPTSAGPQSYQKANENLGLENGLPLRREAGMEEADDGVKTQINLVPARKPVTSRTILP